VTLADGNRTDVEQRWREAVLSGGWVKLGSGQTAADDPAHGAEWGPERTVSAAVLADVLRSAYESKKPRALRLDGARITGQLDLEATTLACPLVLRGCWFEEPIVLAEASAPAVRLWRCWLPGLEARQLTTSGNLELADGSTVTGKVCLLGAHIGGILALSSATLTNPGGPALNGDGLTVDGDMFCREGFRATGEVRLPGAHIGGILEFSQATLSNPGGPAERR